MTEQPSAGVRHALVIEDDADIRMLIGLTLRGSGFEVHEAGTGELGVSQARDLAPELITLDLGLPDIDGFEVCRRIREFSGSYLIMISARPEEVDKPKGLDVGADDFISKPFSPRVLKARIADHFA